MDESPLPSILFYIRSGIAWGPRYFDVGSQDDDSRTLDR